MYRRLQLVLIAGAVTLASAQTPSIADLQRQAQAGDSRAQYRLAAAYIEGKGVAKDPAQGIDWLRKSAVQGYVGAEFALADMYQEGVLNLPKDPHQAATWFRKAAVQQNDAAKTHLADMLAHGLISKQEADWQQSGGSNLASKQTPKQVAKPSSSKPTPFSLAEVETGLTGGITTKRMATLVGTYGVDFSLNEAERKRLTADGADDELLAVISASR